MEQKEITKPMKAIVMRYGAVIWIESDRLEKIEKIVEEQSGHRFFKVNGELIYTGDISGVHSAGVMEETARRKRGEWQCERLKWHKKNEDCECAKEEREAQRANPYADNRTEEEKEHDREVSLRF